MSDNYVDLPVIPVTPTGAAGGDLSGTYPNPSVATVGASSAANIHTSQLLTAASTSSPTASTLVKRDAASNAQLNGLILTPTGARPVAGVAYRGMLFVTQGAPGATDTLSICLKAVDNSYSWIDIITGG